MDKNLSLDNFKFSYGGDLYIGVMTVINSVREVLMLPVLGISNGAQPVLGYNYGAKENERVKAGIKFTIVVPDKNLLTDWMIKMYERGNDDDFIDVQINNWDKWLDEIRDEKGTYSKKIVLKKHL